MGNIDDNHARGRIINPIDNAVRTDSKAKVSRETAA
jgi:hypothetical protein